MGGGRAEESQLVAGRYRLKRRIGSGGMGVVWEAIDEKMDRTVALKQARDPADPKHRKRMTAEARHTAKLQHRHVVTVHDIVFDEDDHPWLVMEYVRSPSLAELIDCGPLRPRRAARIGAQVAEALAKAHRLSIVHGDVKPANILFREVDGGGEDGRDRDHALLGDFGIARLADATVTDSSRAGTPAYAAPETAARGEVTAASDVFSLGSTIYAAVTGTPPFGTEGGLHAVRQRVMTYPVTVPDTAGPLRPVLEWLLVSDPAERPTAEDAARVLHDVANATPPRFERSGHAIRRWVAGRVGRAVALGIASAVLVGGTVAVLVVGLTRGSAEPAGPTATSAAAPTPVGSATAASGLGDVRTADPCALVDPAALRDFGEARIERVYGGFARCDVLVDPSPGDEVDVKVEFFGPRDPDEPEPDVAEDIGVGRLTRGQDDGQECELEIRLPDGNRVDVVARHGDPAANRCGMAEAAVQHAVTELRRGEVPRRHPPLPANSLAALDACTLPGPAALARIPGLDPASAEPGFGRWDCDWSGDEQGYEAKIVFDRHVPFAPSDGTIVQIGGREALVIPGGYADDGCMVGLVFRTFLNERNDPANEVVIVDVTGPPAPEQLCGPARELAGAVAAALPSP